MILSTLTGEYLIVYLNGMCTILPTSVESFWLTAEKDAHLYYHYGLVTKITMLEPTRVESCWPTAKKMSIYTIVTVLLPKLLC